MPATYALYPGATTYPGSTSYPGSVGQVLSLNTYIDLGDPTDPTPNWSVLDNETVRSFSISRGRESELDEMSAGTATLVVDNRDRTFTPTNPTSPYYPYIRPMARFKLTAELDGVEYPLFQGYADSFQDDWPAPGFSDATSTISLTDEFKVLSLQALPSTDPPSDSYSGVVLYDFPRGYWQLTDPAASGVEQATEGGDTLTWDGAGTITNIASPILGSRGEAGLAITGQGRYTKTAEFGDAGDMGGLASMTVEAWMMRSSLSANCMILGPESTSTSVPVFQLGFFGFSVINDSGTQIDAACSGLAANTWYHLAGKVSEGYVQIFVNGAQIALTAFTGVLDSFTGPTEWGIRNFTASTTFWVAQLSMNRGGVAASRLLAHYVAGSDRGFPQQSTGNRVNAILDRSGNTAPRSVMGGNNTIIPDYMRGRAPIDMIRSAVKVEESPSMFFVDRGGTIQYLSRDHRAFEPWLTAYATFTDDGTGLPYKDLTVDYSEAFLTNEYNITREGGLLQTVSDATSISRYFKRSKSETGIESVDDPAAFDMAARLVAKYKDPYARVTSLEVDTSDTTVAVAALSAELSFKLRVKRRLPGSGGLDIDQSSYIQKIDISGDNSKTPWTVRFGVSPV